MNLSPTAGAFLGRAHWQNPPVGRTSSPRLKTWLLAILRFAVTLDQSDRAAVMSLAADMDCAGSGNSTASFTYFVRTSTRLCDCILVSGSPEKAAELRLHINRIDDDRLRRTIEAAVFG